MSTHHRRSIRLPGYDYTQAGGYFVTIATQGRACFFGEVWDGEMRLNPPGQMVERWWVELAHKFPTVGLGEYAIMPNHFHGVIIIHPENEGAHAGAPVRNGARGIVGADLCVGPVARADPTPRADADVNVDPAAEQGAHTGAPVRNGARGIVGADLCVGPAARADADMQRIEEYIRNNPRRWTEDQLHPQAAPNKFNQDR